MGTDLESGVASLADSMRTALLATSIGGTREQLQLILMSLQDQVADVLATSQHTGVYTYRGWALPDD